MSDISWLTDTWNWLAQNKEWLFSGAGLVVLGKLITLFFRKKSAGGVSQKAKATHGSTVIQVGRDFHSGGNDGSQQ